MTAPKRIATLLIVAGLGLSASGCTLWYDGFVPGYRYGYGYGYCPPSRSYWGSWSSGPRYGHGGYGREWSRGGFPGNRGHRGGSFRGFPRGGHGLHRGR